MRIWIFVRRDAGHINWNKLLDGVGLCWDFGLRGLNRFFCYHLANSYSCSEWIDAYVEDDDLGKMF